MSVANQHTNRLATRPAAVVLGAALSSLVIMLSAAAVAGQSSASPPGALSSPPAVAPSAAVASALPGTCAPGVTPAPLDSLLPDASLPAEVASPSPSPDATAEPDTGGSSGDVPDNAVFLTYADAGHAFSIQYVEGWQVVPSADGVAIRDKDSSEVVSIVARPDDIAGYVTATDLPALAADPKFTLIGQDTVKSKGRQLIHVTYHLPAPPDPVTGKRVPSTIDRYYVPGPCGLAIVSLSTPNGVDNVDAFRQMIGSFKWR